MALNLNRQKSEKPNVVIPNSLTQSSGTITAVMGTKVYTVVTSGLAANTRYQLYIVPGGTLVYSTNENSVGPAGYASWILVGAFYANGQVAVSFGSFISSLYDAPTTGPILFDPSVSSFGTLSSYTFIWTRNASRCRIEFAFQGATAAASTALVGVPHAASTSTGRILAGKWNGDATIDSGALVFSPADKNNLRFTNDADNWGVYRNGSEIGNSSFVGGFADYQAATFSNTPIAYL